MSISATFDQLLRGGRVICPASGIDGIRDVAIRNGKIAAVQTRHPADQRQRGDRRHRQAGVARPDRYPRACLSVCHRPLRHECRHGRRAVRRDDVGRSGRPVLHDAARLPAFRRRAGEVARLCIPVGLSGRRAGGPLLSEALQPRRRRHRRHGEVGDGQSRHRSRHQGPCRDRRLRALGHSRHRNGGRDRTPRRSAGLCAFRPALGPARKRHQRRRRRHDPGARDPAAAARATCWRIRSRVIPAASSIARAKCIR